MNEHFNGLTPAEAELLALLAEECGEVVQVVGKILRHGLESHHPDDKHRVPNYGLLAKELGDVKAASDMLIGVLPETWKFSALMMVARQAKMEKLPRYLHHAKVPA